MKTIEIDGRQYKIKVLPPWLQAQIQRYRLLARKVPATPEESDEIEAEMKRCFDRVFTVVTPKPSEEDAGEVFIALLNHLNEAVKEANKDANSFREDERGEGSR